MPERMWNVYLSGEIHTTWRQDVSEKIAERKIPIRLHGPEIDHESSDSCGEKIFGPEANKFWYDHRSAKINTIRTKSVLGNSDIVIVRFGEKYRQWNAAFDAGRAIALGKSVITLHDEQLDHALKEIDAEALAVARSSQQVVEILGYVTGRSF